MSHQNNANKLILSDFHSPQTQEDCNSLCHQQSPNALGLSHVSGEGSSLGPHLCFPTNSGIAWAYSTFGQWRGSRCLCRVWRLPLAHRTVILHSSLALCLMSGNLPSELHPHPPYRYLLCIVSWPFQSMSSLIANQYCVVMLLGVALNLS